MKRIYDEQGRPRCGGCGEYLQEIGDVLPVHLCRKERRVKLPPISDGCAVCGGKEGPLYWSWRFREWQHAGECARKRWTEAGPQGISTSPPITKGG